MSGSKNTEGNQSSSIATIENKHSEGAEESVLWVCALIIFFHFFMAKLFPTFSPTCHRLAQNACSYSEENCQDSIT
jgi:hypothetical protein